MSRCRSMGGDHAGFEILKWNTEENKNFGSSFILDDPSEGKRDLLQSSDRI